MYVCMLYACVSVYMYVCVCGIYVPVFPLSHVTAFVIKVWAAKQGSNFQLAIQRTIDLRRLMYIGNLVKKRTVYILLI